MKIIKEANDNKPVTFTVTKTGKKSSHKSSKTFSSQEAALKWMKREKSIKANDATYDYSLSSSEDKETNNKYLKKVRENEKKKKEAKAQQTQLAAIERDKAQRAEQEAKNESLIRESTDGCYAVFATDKSTGNEYCAGVYDSLSSARYWSAMDSISDKEYNYGDFGYRVEEVPEYSDELLASNRELTDLKLSNHKNNKDMYESKSIKESTTKDKYAHQLAKNIFALIPADPQQDYEFDDAIDIVTAQDSMNPLDVDNFETPEELEKFLHRWSVDTLAKFGIELEKRFGYEFISDDTELIENKAESKSIKTLGAKAKKLNESNITSQEPVIHLKGKSSYTLTKDRKWEVTFDEEGNIIGRTRHGKPQYFTGHINDKVNDFPSSDEDNIILAAREQHSLKFGEKPTLDESLFEDADKPIELKLFEPSKMKRPQFPEDIDIKIDEYFKNNDAPYLLDELYYNKVKNTVEFDIMNGDWKHEHLRAKWLLEDFFKNEGINVDISKHEIGQSEDDTYSAHYVIRTLYEDELSEFLFEDVDIDSLEGPEEGPEFGLTSLLTDAIKDEWEAIETYNGLALSARAEGFEDIAKVIDEINTEENKHVGQLEELLKTISPNAKAIEVGEDEGQEQLENEGDDTSNLEEDIEPLDKFVDGIVADAEYLDHSDIEGIVMARCMETGEDEEEILQMIDSKLS